MYRGPAQKLTVLDRWTEVPLDATFVSHIIRFHRLVNLTLESCCSSEDGWFDGR